MFDVRCSVFDVRCSFSDNKHRTTNIEHRTSNIENRTSKTNISPECHDNILALHNPCEVDVQANLRAVKFFLNRDDY